MNTQRVVTTHAGSAGYAPEFPMEQHTGSTQEDFAAQVEAAARQIEAIVPPTPLHKSVGLTSEVGSEVLLKRDDLTAVHTFKLRGAASKILAMSSEEQSRGVIAASAGNHAQGVAYTAQMLDIEATIVMPTTTPEQKVTAVSDLGAHVVLHGASYSDAYDRSLLIQAGTGATYVHPFDDPTVITGQATLALEILGARPDVTHIFVPVGGGGLLAGTVKLVKDINPLVKVIGVEPTESSMMTQSLEANELLEATHVGGFSDGVAVKKVGVHTFEAAKLADGMITVDDDDICVALAGFVLEQRSVLETAGALGIAGLKKYARLIGLTRNSVSVAICSGANIDNSRLLHALKQAERAADKEALLRVVLPEQPGALRRLCAEVVNGHNITRFAYRKDSSSGAAHITVGLRVRDGDDKQAITNALAGNAYEFVDLSQNAVIKEHGPQPTGDKPDMSKELFYAVQFADRPGALLDLLRSLGDAWNISMFHYGGSEGDTGHVAIGFEGADRRKLEEILQEHTRSFERADEDIALMYG